MSALARILALAAARLTADEHQRLVVALRALDAPPAPPRREVDVDQDDDDEDEDARPWRPPVHADDWAARPERGRR